ncbi:MAG: cytochrome c biogenesis protein CcsA [Candidatus Omnitrophota bacterium]
MSLAFVILGVGCVSYGVAFLLHVLSFAEIWKGGRRAGFVMLQAGFLLGTLYFLSQGFQSGYFLPVVNISAALAFFAWALAFVYLVLLGKIRTESFSIFLAFLLCVLMAGSLASFGRGRGIQAMVRDHPYLLNPTFVLHVVSAFFAYANFAISFIASILYLIGCHELKKRNIGNFYHKLPSLERLERMVCLPLNWGAPLLLFATATGLAWAKHAFGSFLLLDPKTIVTFLVLGCYLLILYRHWVAAVRGKEIAVLSLIAFIVIVTGFIETFFLFGKHNFL